MFQPLTSSLILSKNIVLFLNIWYPTALINDNNLPEANHGFVRSLCASVLIFRVSLLQFVWKELSHHVST
jgi:fumarate reductase subunit D